MSHRTFYRKYRSQSFSELVGQDHIVQTLSNAISHDRLSHAYIFSGPRGTGKTSTARIFAKSLNCRNGASESPCLSCDLCEKIAAGASVDVIEIDAASNTGVDNIRDLNEQVNFVPVECMYKVFIIDEVHMLSTGAFNALLKTLEEPPSHTLFILATTEPHKIPVTIHSRCQRLNFRRLTQQEIVGHLEEVSEKEAIQIGASALSLIARNASGCMRDALSLLDQIYSFTGSEIKEADVRVILGATDFDAILTVLRALFAGDIPAVVTALDGLVKEGVNASQLVADTAEVLRQLIYVQQGVGDGLDIDDSRRPVLSELAASVAFDPLFASLETLSKLEMDLKWMADPDTLMQVSFIGMGRRFAQGEPSVGDVPVLLERKREEASVTPVETAASPAPVDVEKKQEVLRIEEQSVPVDTAQPQRKEEASAPVADASEIWNVVLASIESEPLLSRLLSGSSASKAGAELKVKLAEGSTFHLQKIQEQRFQDLLLAELNAQGISSLRIGISEKAELGSVFIDGTGSAELRVEVNVGDPAAADPISQSSSETKDEPVQTLNAESVAAAPLSSDALLKQYASETKAVSEEDGTRSHKINQVVALFEGSVVS